VPLRLYAVKPKGRAKSLFETRPVSKEQSDYLAKSPTTSRFARTSQEIVEVLEHPVLDLLRRVNSNMNQFDLFELSFLHQELFGNAYWWIMRDPSGLPVEIWPLMPQNIKIIPSKQAFIEAYEYTISSTEKERFEPDEIVHFKYVNPKNSYYGMGPLQACVTAADLSQYMNQYEAHLMLNQGRPDIAIILPADSRKPPEAEQKRVERYFRQKYGGFKNAGKPIWLYGGADIKQVSITPKEMAYLQGRKATMNEIAAVFGVPVSKLTTDDVNRANAEAGDYRYLKDTVLPRLRKFEQKLNEKLLPMYGQENLFVSFDNPVPEDREYRLKELKTHLETGYASINQERAIDGKDPVDWGDVPLLPMNLMPITSSGGATQGDNQGKSRTKGAKRHLPPLVYPSNLVEPEFVTALARYFLRLVEDVAARSEQSKGLKSPADEYVNAWFDVETWNKELGDVISPYISATFNVAGRQALQQVRPEMDFQVSTERAVRALENRKKAVISSVNRTVSDKIRDVVAEGIERGDTIRQIAKNIRNVGAALASVNAERIARTEKLWAWNAGAVEGYKQSRWIKKKIWLSTNDDRTCQYCPQLDGKVIELDANYFDKGSEFPGGGLTFDFADVGHPPLHVNCRCTIAAVIEEVNL